MCSMAGKRCAGVVAGEPAGGGWVPGVPGVQRTRIELR
jgi:hypothetical protein